MTSSRAASRTARPYTRYLALYLALTLGSVWTLTLFYLLRYDLAVSVLGQLELTNPVVIVILNSPAIAALAILLHYDGVRGVANFLKTLVPRGADLPWLALISACMVAYIFAVRAVCQAVGIGVPPDPQSPLEMVATFGRLFFGEAGMIAIAVGWFGFFLPMMHRATRNHLISGVATGVGIGVFVAPGNLFSSFELATAWPLYVAQLCTLCVGMSLLLSRVKGNILFFLVPFWISASGSQMRLYYFMTATQIVQLTLFATLVGVLYLALRHEAHGRLRPPFTFPEYLEHSYTARRHAVVAGTGDRSVDAVRGLRDADLVSSGLG